jgi:hypothetical protein
LRRKKKGGKENTGVKGQIEEKKMNKMRKV